MEKSEYGKSTALLPERQETQSLLHHSLAVGPWSEPISSSSKWQYPLLHWMRERCVSEYPSMVCGTSLDVLVPSTQKSIFSTPL